jgi:voltage-gated potassium channel
MAADSVGAAQPAAAAKSRGSGTPVYQIFMLTLCVLALAAVVLQNLFHLDRDTEKLLEYADTAICVAFLVDFLVTLYRAPNRWRYLYTWGWLDLLSSIPTLDAARWGRLARLARLVRILRAFRATRLLTKIVVGEKAKSTTMAATMIAFLLVIGGSTAILHFEDSPQANIKTAEDAVWWAMTTITTVGYGDRFPVSTGGRLVAVLLMTAGVGLFGTMSAALAAWFISGNTESEEAATNEVALLREEIASLREAVDKLAKER